MVDFPLSVQNEIITVPLTVQRSSLLILFILAPRNKTLFMGNNYDVNPSRNLSSILFFVSQDEMALS